MNPYLIEETEIKSSKGVTIKKYQSPSSIKSNIVLVRKTARSQKIIPNTIIKDFFLKLEPFGDFTPIFKYSPIRIADEMAITPITKIHIPAKIK